MANGKHNHFEKILLENLYINENKTCKQIGLILNCHAQTIHNWLKKYKIKTRNNSESKIGKIHDWGNKISESLKGKKHTEERKIKISEKAKGRKNPLKGMRKASHPEKIKCGMKKEKHWNWKGGISSENILLRQTSEYKEWRDNVFKRDAYTCQFCQKKGGYMQAHHIIPLSTLLKYEENIKNELLFCIDNGTTTCVPCHKEIHA